MSAMGKGRSGLGACAALVVGCLGVACSAAPDSSSELGSVASGASAPQGSEGDAQDADTSDGSRPAGEFVFLSRGASGGYAVDELNAATRTTTVSYVDFSNLGCDTDALRDAMATPRTVAALGAIHGDTFVATSVFRGLPELAPGDGDTFYQATTRRGGDLATAVNVGQQTPITRLDLSTVQAPFVDRTWLTERILAGGAIAAGTLDPAGADLAVTTIYLPVPDDTKCPAPIGSCGEGTVPMYARDPSRCLQFTGCTKVGFCPQYVPHCEDGYQLTTWPSERACPAFACDPTFDPPPVH